MEESLISRYKEALKLKDMDADTYSPLVLAYIGDAIYELVIRTKVVNHGNTQVNKLHKRTAALVKAEAQAQLYMLLEDELTEEEKAVYRRGRNSKTTTMAKNATMKDYRMATGFEALMGWLYLKGSMDRLVELVASGLPKTGCLDGGEKETEGKTGI